MIPIHAFHLLRRYAGTLESQYNRTLKNILDLEKRAHTRSLDRNVQPDVLGPYRKPEAPAPAEEPREEQPQSKVVSIAVMPETKHSQEPAPQDRPIPTENVA